MAYETPLTIAEIVNDISANKYVLPSIQREFVWGTPQIERLFDSIMQGYPIGTFLFWELTNEQITSYTFYSFLQNYHEKNARHNPRINLADLLLSIASAQWKELDARKEITDFVDEINSIGYGFNVNKDFVLKASLCLVISVI